MRWAGSLDVIFHIRYIPCRKAGFVTARRAHRPRCAAAAGLPGWARRICAACPTAPAFPTVRPLPSTTQRIQSRGHSPRTILYGRIDVVLQPRPGGRGSPPLRRAVEGVSVQPASFVDRRRGVEDAAPYGQFVYFTFRHATQGRSPRTISHGRTEVVRPPTPGGRGSPPLRRAGRFRRKPHIVRGQ